MKRTLPLILTLIAGILLLLIINLLIGSVKIPVADVCRILMGDDSNEIWTNIIFSSRLPQALTAIVAGAGLAVSGLQMQTVFRNPLAGPSVLGISNGSALGVAFVVLLSGKVGGVALSRLGYLGDAAMSVAAIIGAMAVLLLILWLTQKVKGNVTLLIIGVMIGYLANAIIGVLKFLAPEEDVKSFVVWGLGSFSRVSGDEMVLFIALMCVLLPLSVGKRHEPDAAGRPLCLESGIEHPSQSYVGDCLFWHPCRHCHSLLRTHHVHRTGSSSFGSCHLPNFRSSYPDARHSALWCCARPVLQLHRPYARLRGGSACQ